ncbi:hypothetical protein KEH51_24470 [[Brevibacterium] frigoritolerans]|uniref:Uncharacterized protein n=1 Tax=Peribacillus frigoritolerans TaxID=450367 RepID=A0A941FQV0_9BACI|nr:hypothetical protein [Peribacillus frigoritolerans]
MADSRAVRERTSEINSNIFDGWKKFATLLPNNWLVKTPQVLAPRRFGRQSAESERISEINCNFFKIRKLQENSFSSSPAV